MARLLAPPDLPRRRLLSAMMLAPLLARQALAAPQPDAPRVVAVEWLPAELLFALGITPIAVADMISYRQWVQQPVLPPEVIDVGERTSPNLELLAELQPDLILYSAGYGPRAEQLKAVAPAMGFAYTDAAGKPLDMARVSIMALAQRLNREALGMAHLAWFDRQLAQAAPTLASYRRQPLLVFSVMDERHALVVGRNHLFQQVLDQLGIDNLWQGETNFWGTAVVGIEKLIALPPGRAILLEQDDGALRQRISKTPLWQAIPFVRQQSWHPAPAIWFYGATLAALRFCRLLERLEGEWS
ncbi:Fe(3+)-hydroxamate ABC transporter substrate-binding protein FhuD [Candidatus Sodalis sp. SoCistrobi]|uniref:Fe(3+)-hydroxamate ABC transporter substrate-binding protein FhuD n=1 Tax=Candidatus Sodalis sp. SoCistrobi TaxID=1922216 RepID=UPI000939F1EB|nr:Fe(3+)-hydroxamate ABC transporter substrate-binding protein FhuD [Candidatus Sodalis sp. SoCistrobi]